MENRRGLAAWSDSSRSETTPLPSDDAQEVGGLELGLAEEVLAARGLQVDQGAQDHARRRRRDAADALEVGLALVGGEVLDDRAQVLGVQERKALLVGPVEDQPERGLLGVVEVQHLRQQDGAELRERGADRDRRALAAQREELDRVRRGRPVVAGVLGARLDLGVVLAGLGHAGEVALDVGQQHRHPGVRQLAREPLQGLGLARAGGARDEAVPVERRERDADLRVGIDLTVDDNGAELQCPALRRVPGSDLLCGVRRVLSHEP